MNKFEQNWGITLPDEYKSFLLLAGSHGAGPYYGLERPEDGVYTDLHYKDELNLVSGSFPYSDAWNETFDWKDETLNYADWEKEYFDTAKSAGLLRICDFGCGVSINLVVNGLSYGEIWVDDRASDYGISPLLYNKERLTFLTWYESWLDQSIEEMENR